MTASVLIIDLSALAANYALFQKTAPGAAVAGILKADAYGIGMEKVWAVLENAGCPLYFTALPEEALALRCLTKKPVAVLGGIPGDNEDEFIHHNLIPVLNSLDDIEHWQKAARKHGIELPAIIHFDTGMNRLGLPECEAARLLAEPQRLENLKIMLVMSHFACADEKDHPLTARQYERFRDIAAHFPQAKKSLANSSGIFRDPRFHFDMARPGMALYGLNPLPETKSPVKPVVSLHTRLLQVKDVPPGETIGYGAAHECRGRTRVGTVALGYADGFLRSNSGKGALYFGDAPCPIIGRVSMDLVTVDLGVADAQPGDMLEVLGPHRDADALAAIAGTIGYEILTSLGRRYERVYNP
jgi:alanine racemase